MSWLLFASSLGVATLVLPPGEDPRGWESPAELAGLEVGLRGGGVWVEIEAHGVTWTLRARGADGAERSLQILAPHDAAGREDAVWLAASLVRALPPVSGSGTSSGTAPASGPGGPGGPATSQRPLPTRVPGGPRPGPPPELSRERPSSVPSPPGELDHPASPVAPTLDSQADSLLAESGRETPPSSTVAGLAATTEVTQPANGGPEQALVSLSTGTAPPEGPGELTAQSGSDRATSAGVNSNPQTVRRPDAPVAGGQPVASTPAHERAAPGVGPYLSVRTAVAWRAGAPAGPSLGGQAGMRVGRGFTLGAGADWGPPIPLGEMGETAAAASWEVLGAATWCPHDQVAPCVGAEAGTALRRYLFGGETLTRFQVPVLGVRAGVWVPLGAHIGLSPFTAAAMDLAPTRLQRGDDPEVNQAALRVSAGLSWTAAPW